MQTTPRCWIAVASADHALRGRDHTPVGFMQVCHGKRAPLQRLRAGDVVAYYAPARSQGGKDRLQSFVSIGVVQPRAPYTVDMGGGFVPHRRDVRYARARPAPIAPLLDALEFVEDRQHWGYKFRFGLFEISTADMRRIAQAMQADTTSMGWDSMAEACDAPTDSLPLFS
ncbi:EVE domain-containing protein [Hydrogenophaga palleronii]|uniref:EVE domain-containing protein n=1 Tax=Hydrogenophaga palleronii TaxID=65655 RepID=UPI000824FE8B|nr:EVE domain-containing protein [Hydrogenophaga palleronii]